MTDLPAPGRRYDKGERRFKHVGRNPWPEIEFDTYEPKKWIGKCPSNLPVDTRTRLLNDAVPAANGDRDLTVPRNSTRCTRVRSMRHRRATGA